MAISNNAYTFDVQCNVNTTLECSVLSWEVENSTVLCPNPTCWQNYFLIFIIWSFKCHSHFWVWSKPGNLFIPQIDTGIKIYVVCTIIYSYFDWDQRNYPSIQEQYQPCLRPGKRSFFLTLPSPLPPSAQVWVAIFLCVLHLRWKCKCRKNVWRLLQQMDSIDSLQ